MPKAGRARCSGGSTSRGDREWSGLQKEINAGCQSPGRGSRTPRRRNGFDWGDKSNARKRAETGKFTKLKPRSPRSMGLLRAAIRVTDAEYWWTAPFNLRALRKPPLSWPGSEANGASPRRTWGSLTSASSERPNGSFEREAIKYWKPGTTKKACGAWLTRDWGSWRPSGSITGG